MTAVIKSLFGSNQSLPSTQQTTTPAATADRSMEAERQRQRRAGGIGSTILTSGAGVAGSANIGTTTLLGR